MENKYKLAVLVATSVLLTIGSIGCGDSTGAGGLGTVIVGWSFNAQVSNIPAEEVESIPVFAWPSGVDKLVITIDAADMSPVTVEVTDTEMESEYVNNVPAGSNRTVTVEAYDYNVLMYKGETSGVTVTADAAVSVNVTLDLQIPVWREFTSPTTYDLDAIDMISANNGWICGRYGTLLHYDGSAWNKVDAGTTKPLYDVSFVNSGNGWIVGPGGLAIRYSNGNLESYTVPNKPALFSVITISKTEAWAVGEWGVIYGWDGSSWSKFYSPVEGSTHASDLNNVTTDSRGVAWACGSNGSVVKEGAGGWTLQSTVGSSSNYLISIKFPSDFEGWTVGEHGYIWHYEVGAGWEWQDSPTPNDLRGVSMYSTQFGMVAGAGGALAVYENGSWRLMTNPVGDIFLNDIECVSEKEGWAIGSTGTILHYSE